jgi:AAA family ATP:ADP antiporter
MLSLTQRVFGLKPRELARAIPLFAYLFLIMAGSVASKAARDALFLDRFRAIDLPYVDIAIAVIVGLVAGLYIRAGERTNVRNVQIGSLVAFAASSLVFWWLAEGRAAAEPSAALFIVIYIWVGVLSVLVPSQVWTLANYVLTTREAKKSFGLIGGGAILGWIVGGFATRFLVMRFGTESTLLWVATTLLMSAALVWYIWRQRPARVDATAATIQLRLTESRLLATFAQVRSSRYLVSIALVVWLAAYVTTIAGWQFKAIAKANIPDTDALASFFGTFNIVAGLAALGLQLLLTGRILQRMGVGFALFIVPTALALSSVGVLIAGTLAAAVALKASDQVLRYSVDKATVELLYLPVPAGLTFRVKSFIDTVVYRLGDAMGGFTILLFAAALRLTPVQMAWVSLALVGAWFWAASTARRQYVANLRDSIHQHRVDTERANAPVISRETADLIGARLVSGTPGEILYALSLFEMARDYSLHPAVRTLLKHESGEVRQHALRLLSNAADMAVLHDVERLLYDEQLEVRTEALLYLAEHAHIDPLERIEQLGDFPDFSLRAAMAAFLARPGRSQNLEAARAIIGAMVTEGGPAGSRTRLEAAKLLAILPDVFDRELVALLQDEDPDVAAAALLVVSSPRKPAFIERVIEELMDNIMSGNAIVRHRIITALNKLLQQHPDGRIDRRLLETLLHAEIMGHYRSYQSIAAPHQRLGPGAQAVAETMRQETERIFRLLKMLHPEHDMHSAYVGLQSNDPVVHDNAVEFLDAVLAPELRSLVIPLFDRDVSPRDRAHIAAQLLNAPIAVS